MSYSQNTIYIPQNVGENSSSKSGWNLLFEETFENQTSINTTKWNKSSWGNDGYCKDDVATNPDNVSVSAGTAKIKLTNTSYNGCQFSTGEILGAGLRLSVNYDHLFELPVSNLYISAGAGISVYKKNIDFAYIFFPLKTHFLSHSTFIVNRCWNSLFARTLLERELPPSRRLV
jgi:hypothetical protein